MTFCDVAVIGTGFAGAATAYHLARQGITDVLLLEQETIPGFHSSGRNAAMIRQCVPDPAVAKLARDGAAFLHNFPPDWPAPVQFKRNGSLLLGKGEGWEKLKWEAGADRALGVDVALWTPDQAKLTCRCSWMPSLTEPFGARATVSSTSTRYFRVISKRRQATERESVTVPESKPCIATEMALSRLRSTARASQQKRL